MNKWLLVAILYVGIGVVATLTLNKWIQSMIDWVDEKYCLRGDELLWEIRNRTIAIVLFVMVVLLWPISYPIRIGHIAVKFFAIKREYLKKKEEREKTDKMINDLLEKWEAERTTA